MGIIILGLLPVLFLYLLIFQTRMLVGIIGFLFGMAVLWVVGMGMLAALFSWLGA